MFKVGKFGKETVETHIKSEFPVPYQDGFQIGFWQGDACVQLTAEPSSGAEGPEELCYKAPGSEFLSTNTSAVATGITVSKSSFTALSTMTHPALHPHLNIPGSFSI